MSGELNAYLPAGETATSNVTPPIELSESPMRRLLLNQIVIMTALITEVDRKLPVYDALLEARRPTYALVGKDAS